jgi:hypothetical protein
MKIIARNQRVANTYDGRDAPVRLHERFQCAIVSRAAIMHDSVEMDAAQLNGNAA